MMIRLSGQGGLKWRALPLIRFFYRLFGRNWNDFYSWMLDRQERGNTIEDIIRNSPQYTGREKGLYDLSVAEFHIPLLERCGMTAKSRVLDFGCGFGRSAPHLVPYLKPGNYVGVDLSAERIRMANEYMARENLQKFSPSFHVARRNNSLSFLPPKSFDIVWARAVLAHMPLDGVRLCLAEILGVLKDDGVFVGDIALTPKGTKKTSVKDFWVEESIIRQMIADVGFNYDYIEDWQIGISAEHKRPDDMYRMLRLTKRN